MRQASHEATILLYSPGIDPFLENLIIGADRVFYFEEGPQPRQGCSGLEDLGGFSHNLIVQEVFSKAS